MAEKHDIFDLETVILELSCNVECLAQNILLLYGEIKKQNESTPP